MIRKLVPLFSLVSLVVKSQTVSLNDLSSFKNPSANWSIVGDAVVDLAQNNAMSTTAGKGVLACIHPKGKYGRQYDLLSNFEHGDADVEFDFMMARGSNSGFYLQGRYEIQLFDSWGVRQPHAHDLGAIYERWDESRPSGQKGYEGYAPRMNASKAPGLWQHMKIIFQAPRFDGAGKKIANAKVLKIEVNGITVQENVELAGPTRGSLDGEVAKGPILIQGDHGCVAFRNLSVKQYGEQVPQLKDLKYAQYDGIFMAEPDYSKTKLVKEGSLEKLTYDVANKDNGYLLRFTGKLVVPVAGEYRFQTVHNGGNGILRVNNEEILKWKWWDGQAKVTLPAGEVPFEYVYNKNTDWAKSSLGLSIESDFNRAIELQGLGSVNLSSPTNPILVAPGSTPVVHRSFFRSFNENVSHGISVGEPTGIHYAVNLEKGALARVWKGDFLDVTPMWNDRGNGMSIPQGSVLNLSNQPTLALIASDQTAWPASYGETDGFRQRGYEIDAAGRPTFKYDVAGVKVEDQIRPDADSKFLNRELRITGTIPATLKCRLAMGKEIVKISDNTFVVDKSYYIQADGAAIRTIGGNQELVVPAASKINYSLMW
ncbi:family 16 glycoside hydrolase [Runella limosa]|uniref:family 16 glycoside hydrolase n=1 Tax=Runella limosa TaxID=370978 RepID=UPI000419166B|nr:family 16 glycoside hydrolase [Runella limosa]